MHPQIKTLDDIKKLGRILGVWAHPDDESFCAAGILSAAVSNGQKVACITATKGEDGVQDHSRWPADRLGEIRAQELNSALNILGIREHHWLDYPDGACAKVDKDVASTRLRAFIETFRPDSILTFGPDGLTGHNDHRSVSAWVDLASQGSGSVVYHVVEEKQRYETYFKALDKQFNIYFNIDKPPLCDPETCDIDFELTPELVEAKYAALRAMPSQTEALLGNIPKEKIKYIFGVECYVKRR